ncbi:MAG TPA: YfhO family protein, partial [Kiritimatiellia bacterium]|nr:YfhO family protein [Kiritimatiellia bacterium]
PAPEVEIERLIPGRCEFTVKNHGPVVMRVAEKFDPNWQATVDGQSRPVLRIDYMFQGVAIEEAGTHRVVLAYYPSSLPVVLQWIGVLAGLGAAGWLAVPRRRKEAAA